MAPRLVVAAALTLAVGCASRGPVSAPAPPPATEAASPVEVAAPAPARPLDMPADDEPWTEVCAPFSEKCQVLYDAAVEAAMVPRAQNVSRRLQALIAPRGDATPGEPEQVWNDKGQILMTTWTRRQYFVDENGDPIHQQGDRFPLYGDTWFTAVPAMRDFCRRYRNRLDDDRLVLRLEQRMGLPPSPAPEPGKPRYPRDVFLQVWIDPAKIFRPCPDPEISDHECQVAVPVVEAEGEFDCPAALPAAGAAAAPCAAEPRPPWSCAYREQVSSRFVVVQPGHLAWMCQNWLSTYTGEKKFPWTALGYTYDWGSPLDPRGASEFVVPGGELVTYDSLVGTFEYCGKEPASPSEVAAPSNGS